MKLNRPVNTGDDERNRAEVLATQRLFARAEARNVDAIMNVKFHRSIAIGLHVRLQCRVRRQVSSSKISRVTTGGVDEPLPAAAAAASISING